MVPADDKFKFGPSGPFRCSEKLKFPIEVDSELFWVEVALVEANIPMLLGNNILKPLGALIKLFTSGNGVLVLNEVEIPMKETTGGHFIVKITDLGKLCDKFNDISTFCAMKEHKCNKCDEIFDSRRVLENHLITKHGAKDSHCKSGYSRPALKNKQINSIVQNKSCLHEVETDLNTLQNGARSKREHRMIQVMKKFALQVKQEGLDFECDVCDANSGNRKDHRVENVQETKELKCKDCGKWFEEQNKTHEKEVKSNYKCDQCVKYYMDKDNLSSHKIDEHDLNIFMVHHVEEDDDCEFEMNTAVWDILLFDNCDGELRYFAHRSGQKLWENLFQPAGKFKGKKRLVLEFLGKRNVCRKFKRTLSRPKVGLPKAKVVNEVVSIDLKIFNKDGKK